MGAPSSPPLDHAAQDAPAGGERPPLWIVGASARAAAGSALRAGFSPRCADLYADVDLAAFATVRQVQRFPRQLRSLIDETDRETPWIFTGGLENHPRVVSDLAARRPLLGTGAPALRSVRDPRGLMEIDSGEGPVRIAPVWTGSEPPPRDGGWMRKPRRGSGGRAVAVWNDQVAADRSLREAVYHQKRIVGESLSAICLASESDSVVLAWMRQWTGEPICGATGFHYCGSLGPIRLAAEVDAAMSAFLGRLRQRHALRGLFGCDFVRDDAALWLTEINPRYTASVELFEWATGRSALSEHVRACGGRPPPIPKPRSVVDPAPCLGKAILFATRSVVVPPLPLSAWDAGCPEVADVPAPGSKVPKGAPICTLYASGHDDRSCDAALRERIQEFRSSAGWASPALPGGS